MKRKKKKLIIASTISSIGLLTANLFSSPKEIIKNQTIDNSHIEIMNNNSYIQSSSIIDKIPLLFKVLVLIPLWLLGTIVIKALNKLLLLIGSPLLRFLIRTLLIFLILLLIIIFILKLLFPNKKLKELITKKLILYTFVGSIVLNIVDLLLSKNKKYQKIKNTVLLILGIIILLLILKPFIKKKYYEPKIIYDHSIYD